MPVDISNIARSQGIDLNLYNQIQPLVQQVVDNFGTGRNLTETDINRMTDEVIATSMRSGVPFAGYSNRSLNEAVRLLVLLHLFNNGYDLNTFWQLYYGGIPFFLLPFLIGRRPPVRPVPPIAPPRPPVRPVPPIAPPRPPVRPVPPIAPPRPPFGSPGRPGIGRSS